MENICLNENKEMKSFNKKKELEDMLNNLNIEEYEDKIISFSNPHVMPASISNESQLICNSEVKLETRQLEKEDSDVENSSDGNKINKSYIHVSDYSFDMTKLNVALDDIEYASDDSASTYSNYSSKTQQRVTHNYNLRSKSGNPELNLHSPIIRNLAKKKSWNLKRDSDLESLSEISCISSFQEYSSSPRHYNLRPRNILYKGERLQWTPINYKPSYKVKSERKCCQDSKLMRMKGKVDPKLPISDLSSTKCDKKLCGITNHRNLRSRCISCEEREVCLAVESPKSSLRTTSLESHGEYNFDSKKNESSQCIETRNSCNRISILEKFDKELESTSDELHMKQRVEGTYRNYNLRVRTRKAVGNQTKKTNENSTNSKMQYGYDLRSRTKKENLYFSPQDFSLPLKKNLTLSTCYEDKLLNLYERSCKVENIVQKNLKEDCVLEEQIKMSSSFSETETIASRNNSKQNCELEIKQPDSAKKSISEAVETKMTDESMNKSVIDDMSVCRHETAANNDLVLKLTKDDFDINGMNTIEEDRDDTIHGIDDLTKDDFDINAMNTVERDRDDKIHGIDDLTKDDFDINGMNTVEEDRDDTIHGIDDLTKDDFDITGMNTVEKDRNDKIHGIDDLTKDDFDINAMNTIEEDRDDTIHGIDDFGDMGSNTRENTTCALPFTSSSATNEATEEQNAYPNPYKGVVLMAKTMSGHIVEIKVDQDRPKSFKNEKARVMWDEAVYRNALKLKDQIEKGEFIPDDIKRELDRKIQMKEEEKSIVKKDRILDRKKNKLKWLKLESRLVELDALVKSNLSLTKADPDRCLAHLDEISSLSIDPLMLKKHPQVVETIKKLRRYIGNTVEWNYDNEQKTKFATKAGQIRDKADHIYNKFKAMFTVPEGRTFWQVFADHVTLFKQQTSHLSQDKVYSLTVDPNVSKRNADSGSSEEEQTESQKSQEEGAADSEEGEEENRAPDIKKVTSRDDARRR